MRVLVVEPGILPYEKEINGLKEMQEVVGGSITALYPWEDQAAIVCNDEALLLNLPFNRSVEGDYGGVFGPFFVCGLGEEDFCSLTPEQVKAYKAKFRQAELWSSWQTAINSCKATRSPSSRWPGSRCAKWRCSSSSRWTASTPPCP